MAGGPPPDLVTYHVWIDFGQNEVRGTYFRLPAEVTVAQICAEVAAWASKELPKGHEHAEAPVPVWSQIALYHGHCWLDPISTVAAPLRRNLVARLLPADWQELINNLEGLDPQAAALLLQLSEMWLRGEVTWAEDPCWVALVRLFYLIRKEMQEEPQTRGATSTPSDNPLLVFVTELIASPGTTPKQLLEVLEEEFRDYLSETVDLGRTVGGEGPAGGESPTEKRLEASGLAHQARDDWAQLLQLADRKEDQQLLLELRSSLEVGDPSAFDRAVKLMLEILESPEQTQRGVPVLRGGSSGGRGEALFEFVRLVLLPGLTAGMLCEQLAGEFGDFLSRPVGEEGPAGADSSPPLKEKQPEESGLAHQVQRGDGTLEVEQVVEQRDTMSEEEETPVLPPIRAALFNLAVLLRDLDCGDGLRMTVPGSTERWLEEQHKTVPSAAFALEPRRPFPLGFQPYSMVVQLGPHLVDDFPVPIGVTIPLLPERPSGHQSSSLDFWVLEEEAEEWKRVPGGVFDFHLRIGRLNMKRFCQGVIGTGPDGECRVLLRSWLNPEPIRKRTYKGRIRVDHRDCERCWSASPKVDEMWREDGFQCQDREERAQLPSAKHGDVEFLIWVEGAEEEQRQVWNWQRINVPVVVDFVDRDSVIYVVAHNSREYQLAQLFFRSPMAAEPPPAPPPAPPAMPRLPGALLAAPTAEGHVTLGVLESQAFEGIDGFTVNAAATTQDFKSLIRDGELELVILSCHNARGKIHLQDEALTHEEVEGILLECARQGRRLPACFLLAMCHGKQLAERLTSLEVPQELGVELVVFWGDSGAGNGVPDSIATLHAKIFAEALRDVAQWEPSESRWKRYYQAFTVSKDRLSQREEELKGDDYKNRFWVRPTRGLLQNMAEKSIEALLQLGRTRDPIQDSHDQATAAEVPATATSSGTTPAQSEEEIERSLKGLQLS